MKTNVSIYQVDDKKEEAVSVRFLGSDKLEKLGLTINARNYKLVYSYTVEGPVDLDQIYQLFNIDHPEDFRGHSLSVSDVVVIEDRDHISAHFCDSIGWKEVPEFMQGILNFNNRITNERIRTPRGTFYIANISPKEANACGYGIHHQSDDGKWLIVGNGTSAIAIKSAE